MCNLYYKGNLPFSEHAAMRNLYVGFGLMASTQWQYYLLMRVCVPKDFV